MTNTQTTLIYTSLALIINTQNAVAHEGNDPLLSRVMIDQLEIRNANNNPSAIEAQAWVGHDLNKLWLKTDIEQQQGTTTDAELQALLSHAIAPFWDLQIGLRQDIKPTPNHTWAAVGIQGIAPYFFAIDAQVFIGESGNTAARLKAEYDLRFTQRLILTPNIEVNLYGQNDRETKTTAGFSDTKAGLRLGYEIQREFTPYVGIDWHKQHGEQSKNEWVLGLRAWF